MLEVPDECAHLPHASCARKVMWMVAGSSQTWIQNPPLAPSLSSSGPGPRGRWPTSWGLDFLPGQHCWSVRTRGCSPLREPCGFPGDACPLLLGYGGVLDSGAFVFHLPQNCMNLPPDKVQLLSQYDNEKKWELICDQVCIPGRLTCPCLCS